MALPSIKNICIPVCIGVSVLLGSSVWAGETDTLARPDLSKWVSRDANWALRLPQEETVVYQGESNLDNAGASGNGMLYPAPNVAGFLVAVVTQGILVESTKNHQKSKMQKTADKVLSPYQAVLSTFGQKDLMQRGLAKVTTAGNKRLIGNTDNPADALVVASEPVFSMTQDQTALVLDNTVSIFTPDAPSVPAYQNKVRVVSQTKNAEDLVQFWTADQGEKLKEESASLLAESLDVVFADLGNPDKNNKPDKTVRYIEGGRERMERGQVIARHCDRIVLKNLRGWFMSVPVSPQGTSEATAGSCDVAAASLR